MPGEGTHKIQQLTDSLVDTMVRLSYGTTLYHCPLEEMVNKLFNKMMTNSFTQNSYSKVHIQAQDTAASQPSFWSLYMVIWPHGLHKLNVLYQPNSTYPNIQFTTGQEEGGHFPFLDIYLYSSKKEFFSHTVYLCLAKINKHLHATLKHHLASPH